MDVYIGEIRLFSGAFAPRGWHLCDGSLLEITDHAALYLLIGTSYGGDGDRTFGLPDMRGRLPVGQGHGTNLTPRILGQTGGEEAVCLAANHISAHSHSFRATTSAATSSQPSSSLMLATLKNSDTQYLCPSERPSQQSSLAANAVGEIGGNAHHNNVMPSLAISFIIALTGRQPQR